MSQVALARSPTQKSDDPVRGLGLFDSTMFVVGPMIRSGVFIVPAGGDGRISSFDHVAGLLIVLAGMPICLAVRRDESHHARS